TVASAIETLSYEFTNQAEGTWVFRVQGVDSANNKTTEYSATSAAVAVDKSPPFPPSAEASREPDFAGNGGWYKDSVEVAFTSNGDKPLSDGSAGSGVDPTSVPSPATVRTSGSDTVCGSGAG